MSEHVDVLVVGAGPAGLAAARTLARGGVRDVLVLDRESQPGGVPRHCHHGGFGLRDLHRSMKGPRYAETLVHRALDAGVQLQTESMVTGWSDPQTVTVTSPAGVRTVTAMAIVLATGARERPRSARLVAGDRPDGVFTTGQLQQWWYLRGLPVGHRALVVGAEHVSYSAVLTLRAAGVTPVAMVTSLPRHQTVAGFAAMTQRGLHVPLWTGTDVVALHGHGRLEAVELSDRGTAANRNVAVDTVVFTGDWVPDNELARSAGARLDPTSRSPLVDQAGASSVSGLYAAGNLAHPAEAADIAALRGASLGASLARSFGELDVSERRTVEIVVEPPLLWSSPAYLDVGSVARVTDLPHGLVLRTAQFGGRSGVIVEQGARELARFHRRHLVPNRALRLPLTWAPNVDPGAGPVRIRLR
ncbi:MAG TPA: FAD-dependent oxidoreductase [Mycobacteriales bacterium]|jgi:thioredoxin reductase|nr:FAD-dependent oxidoreductase [Mycobacteriales bacterium]